MIRRQEERDALCDMTRGCPLCVISDRLSHRGRQEKPMVGKEFLWTMTPYLILANRRRLMACQRHVGLLKVAVANTLHVTWLLSTISDQFLET